MPIGSSVVTGDESIIFTDNFSIDGSERGTSGGKFTADGQLMIGSTTGRHIRIGTLASSDSSVSITNGPGSIDLIVNGSFVGKTITGDSGGALSPTAGNWNVLGLGETSTSGSGSTLSILSPRAYQYIVDPTLNNGTHQTIAAALAAASSGETIGIRPGTYTENLTLKDGVDLVGLNSGPFDGNVVIVGKLSASFAGACGLYNLYLQTNTDYVLEITGTNATVLNLNYCHFQGTNNSLFNFASTGNQDARFHYCTGNLTTTGINYFAIVAGNLRARYCFFGNSAASTTPSTVGAGATSGNVNFQFCVFANALTSAGTASINAENTFFTGSGSTVICGGTGSNDFGLCSFDTGSSVCLTVNQATQATDCSFNTTATYAIDGSSTLTYCELSFENSSSAINPTVTQSLLSEGPSKLIGKSYPAGDNYLTVQNTDNTSTASHAYQMSSVGGASGGDPYYRWNVSGTTDFVMGIDNTDSDALKITDSTTPSAGNAVWKMTTAGEQTLPLQPSFYAYLATTDSNETGNGTQFYLGDTDVGTTLTELYDRNADFVAGASGGAVFTAPQDGIYKFVLHVRLTGTTANNSTNLSIYTGSNRTAKLENTFASKILNGLSTIQLITEISMDASDTAKFSITVTGDGSDVVDISGSGITAVSTFVAGRLVA